MAAHTFFALRRLAFGAVLALAGASTQAGLELGDQSTKTVGATTVTWDSSFTDLSYDLGATITMEVNWTVDAGAAQFSSFRQRPPMFTPKGSDAAGGSLTDVRLLQSQPGGGTVQVTFHFSKLHCDADREREIGNAHFALDLTIDSDGDGVVDSVVAYGVNVHVEDPGACTPPPGGPPAARRATNPSAR